MKKRSLSASFLLIAFLSFALSGCVKARFAISVNPDGSGTLAVAVGMTQQMLAFAGGQATVEGLGQELSDDESPEDSTVRRWREGEYEWFEQTAPFTDLDDLNDRLNSTDFFNSFSLVRQPGFFKNRFVLEAQLDSLYTEEDVPQDLLFDPAGMFEFQIHIQLPGNVVETNGVYDESSNAVQWTINNYEPLEIRAVSEVWNWTNVGLVAAMVVLMVLIAIAGWPLLFTRKDRELPVPVAVSAARVSQFPSPSDQRITQVKQIHNNIEPASRLNEKPSDSPVDIFGKINARSYLEQVSRRALKGRGVISQSPNELRLVWPVSGENAREREISIRVQDSKTLTINGKQLPATAEGIKQGLITSLKEWNKTNGL